MTSQGSPYSRFKRAMATGNLLMIRAAAAELPKVPLVDALRICWLIAEREPHRAQAAGVRWISRLCFEHPGVTLEHVDVAARALRQGASEDDRRRLEALVSAAG